MNPWKSIVIFIIIKIRQSSINHGIHGINYWTFTILAVNIDVAVMVINI
jgi:hypothetical protein